MLGKQYIKRWILHRCAPDYNCSRGNSGGLASNFVCLLFLLNDSCVRLFPWKINLCEKYTYIRLGERELLGSSYV